MYLDSKNKQVGLASLIWVRFLILCLFGTGIFGASLSYADQFNKKTESQNPQDLIALLDTPIHHQIPLANDKFRIDFEIDKITLAFFRKNDTAPIVLTLPDGRKWYASRHPKDQVQWRTGHNYDFIEIKNPLPGPWQVTGQIMPESRVMVVSEIEFHPEPFPPLVFVGEQLKLTGTLSQAGEPISQLDFRNVIRLELSFYSVNDPKYDNFGQPPVRVGEYFDDGRLLDEKPRDGIFTGQFELGMAAGLYIPKYLVRTPLHERLFEADPILVHRTPVRPQIEVSLIEGQAHELFFEVDEEMIEINDIVIDGRVNYPNGERQQIAISTAQGDSLKVRIPSYTYGVFELRSRMSGTDKYGREFQLNLPYFEFRSQRQRETGPSPEELAAAAEAEAREKQHQIALEEVALSRMETQKKIILVVAANLFLVAAWGLFMLMKRPKLHRSAKKK